MGEIKKHGLLGFHFVFDGRHAAYLHALAAKFDIRDVVKDHSSQINNDEYLTLKNSGAFKSLTTYYKLDPFRLLISELNPHIVEVWFGFYPQEDISEHKNILADLLDKCSYCVCGFEIEISDYDRREIYNSQATYYLIENGIVSKSSGSHEEEQMLISHYVSVLVSF